MNDNDKEDIYKLDEDLEENKENKNNNDKDDLMKKLTKYGIIFLVCFILFIFMLAFITSCSRKEKKKLSENLNLSVGDSYTLNYTDFEWTSSNQEVAVVNNNKIDILKEGDVTVTITSSEEIITYTIHSEEKDAKVAGVKLSSNTIEVENGKTYDLTAKLIPEKSKSTITWFSSNENVATVKDGVISAVNPGTCMITVKTENGYTDTCLVKVLGDNSNNPVKSITIDSIDLSLNKGTSYPLSYKVEPSNSVNLVTWESSNNEIATVENGVIYPLSSGTVEISAKSGNINKSIKVTVIDKDENNKIILNQNEINLKINDTYTLVPKGSVDKVTWVSSDDSIATVDGNGVVTGKRIGNTIITAKAENGNSAQCLVTVSNEIINAETIELNVKNVSLNLNDTVKLVESISPSNGSIEVFWESSNTSVATVENGLVKAIGSGTATITASLPNGKKAECVVDVTPKNIKVIKVTLNASIVTLGVNGTSQLTATILPDNATDKTVSWKSSNSSIASVDDNGKVSAKGIGRAVIYASTASGVFDECEIIVK